MMFQQSLNECSKHSKLYCEQCHSSSKLGRILYYNCKMGMKIANFEIKNQHMNAKWVKAQ
jgi:hypothetical protein